jgi:hypothetical protein
LACFIVALAVELASGVDRANMAGLIVAVRRFMASFGTAPNSELDDSCSRRKIRDVVEAIQRSVGTNAASALVYGIEVNEITQDTFMEIPVRECPERNVSLGSSLVDLAIGHDQ